MPPIYLVRHGESVWNRQGKIQGIRESPLTKIGRAQARSIGERLVSELGDVQFELRCSPQGRARETAEIICECLGRPATSIVTDDRIRDFNVGILAGFSGWEAVGREYPEQAKLRLEDPLSFHPPQGENGAAVFRRVTSFLKMCELGDQPILAVSHGVINKFIRAARRGIRGASIIALDEEQKTIYRLDSHVESRLEASEIPAR